MEHEREKYRAVFDTDMGVEVLTDMMVECGLFENAETPGEIALLNYIRSVLEKVGILDAEHINNCAITRKLMELPLIPRVAKDGDRDNEG